MGIGVLIDKSLISVLDNNKFGCMIYYNKWDNKLLGGNPLRSLENAADCGR